jgi:hypothetical protein
VHDFPDKKLAQESHTHDLRKLLSLAELNEELETAVETQPLMQSVLDTAQEWSGTTRFEKTDNLMILAFPQSVCHREGFLRDAPR